MNLNIEKKLATRNHSAKGAKRGPTGGTKRTKRVYKRRARRESKKLID